MLTSLGSCVNRRACFMRANRDDADFSCVSVFNFLALFKAAAVAIMEG